MKKTACVLLAAFLSFLPAFPAFAANQEPRLVDGADLLSDGEETVLLEKLDEISARQRADVVVVTADSLEGKSPMEYADDFYDENGYGFSAKGSVLVCRMPRGLVRHRFCPCAGCDAGHERKAEGDARPEGGGQLHQGREHAD